MTSQLDLFERPAADSANPELEWFLQILKSSGTWMTATAIITRMPGWPIGENSKRSLRRLASQTTLVISGDNGYRHLDSATTAEIEHFAGRLRSQAHLMLERVEAVERQTQTI